MFENAAKRFYNGQQPMADCQPMAPPPRPQPAARSPTGGGARTAEREVARILRLSAMASAAEVTDRPHHMNLPSSVRSHASPARRPLGAQVLELPATHTAEEARRRYHRLARCSRFPPHP